MPYGVTVGALAIFFIIIEIVFIAQRRLLPGTMMLLSFILLVLFIAGIIGTAIQLFAGPNINNQCNTYVFNESVDGPNRDTLAWLQQRNICKFFSPETGMWKCEVLRMYADIIVIHRSKLASRIRILDYWDCVFGLDDDHGESGEFESVQPIVAILLPFLLLHSPVLF